MMHIVILTPNTEGKGREGKKWKGMEEKKVPPNFKAKKLQLTTQQRRRNGRLEMTE